MLQTSPETNDATPVAFKPPQVTAREAWPPNYTAVLGWRQQQLRKFRANKNLLYAARCYYARPENAVEFICHWMDTYDPRNAADVDKPARMPLVLFPKQAELVDFVLTMVLNGTDGLTEKSRDMGATWVCCGISIWMWLFWEGSSIGWGSRKEQLVDKLGVPDSIFEKLRILIRNLPKEFQPEGFKPSEHMTYMRIVNPENNATITGEAGNNIGRGGRNLVYFKDESAHYERPDLIEAALGDNTNCQIDISSVNGLGNVFHRKREAGKDWMPGEEPARDRTNVFVMDWRDHPAKDDQWYLDRKAKAESAGLLALFAQEVERNYAASVDGIIIRPEWVAAAVDAHLKLDLPVATGPHIGGLDVADEGGDLNAYSERQGYLLHQSDDWGEGDVGDTTRRAIQMAGGNTQINYDSIGVGAGVKSESNRLKTVGKLPKGIEFISWSAAATPLDPEENYIPDDEESPLNRDMFRNLKAQAWWQVARRFERTFLAVTKGLEFDPDDLISLPSTLRNLQQLKKELSQAVMTKSLNSSKMVVQKTPDGTRSPNMADSVIMAYWNVPSETFDLAGLV